MGSFSTSLSGLDAEQQALSVISNDLSNLNTTAFKSGTPVFSDLFYQMLGTDGAGDPVQVGVGATMSSVDSPFTQGDITSTGVPTDVAIEGNGLFVLDQGGTQVYSRAGDFKLNSQGNLTDTNGNNVMGYAAVNGAINTTQGLSPIVISMGQSYAPAATSTMQLNMNLDAADTSLEPATGTLTVPAPTLPTDGQTANIGGTVYTFATSITAQSAADTVLIGADVPSTLANLASAINATTGIGTTYSSGTVANATVTATSTANVLNLQAINTGTIGNSDASSTSWTAGSFGAADLTGGVNDQQATGTLTVPPPLPTAGETVTVGGTTYTFATAITAQSAADTVLIGNTVQATLANLAGAINGSTLNGQAGGTTYSSTTTANSEVTATGSAATSLSLQAFTGGIVGNAYASSSQWTAGTFGAKDLRGGVDAVPATSTFTATGVAPNDGDTVSLGATTYTFVANTSEFTQADQVLIGGSVQSALANLAKAINGSGTIGQDYSSGTTNNLAVQASNPTGTTITLQATTGGTGSNTFPTSTSWTGGIFAVATLTGGTASAAASATLTVPAASQPSAAGTDTIDVAGTTYTFVSAVGDLTAPNTVLIGNTTAATLADLAAAINGTSNGVTQGQGITYGTNTSTNTSVQATAPGNNTLSLQATQRGPSGNAYAVSTTWTSALVGGGDLAGGADAIQATGTMSVAIPLPGAGQTVSVGGTAYTFQTTLNAMPANTVLIGGDVQSTLAHLAEAINGTTGSGTDFTGTTQPNTSVTATATATTVALQAIAIGTNGNSTTTSTTWAGGSFATGTLSGGVNAAAASGAYTVPISLPTTGQTVTIGGTTYTFVPNAAALTSPNDVVYGPDVTTTLANLASAINATPAGAGNVYATGTIANASVTATAPTATALTLQSIQNGSAGNSVNTSTTWAAGSFGSSDLAGGTDAGIFSTPITVYDSLGNSHVLTFNFTKEAAGEWTYQITVPAADVGTTGAAQVVATGTLQFGPDGTLLSPASDVQGITIDGLTGGAKPLTLDWQLFSSPGNSVITQTSEPSAASDPTQNGYAAGTLQKYTIDNSGVINGVLSNGQTVSLGQIAVATFANYDGMTNLGSNDYQASLSSGAASVLAPGTGGSGTLDGESLEASNVDIATALTQLIEAERGYEANAKAITTTDNVMQASINLIQG